MARLKAKINGKKVYGIENLRGLELKAQFSRGNRMANLVSENATTGELATSDISMVLDAANIANKHIDNGNILEPLMLELQAVSSSLNYEITRLLIDLRTASFTGCRRVEAPLILDKKLDWLNEKAAGITFNQLYDEGYLSDSDAVDCAYVRNDVPDYLASFMALLSLYTLQNELRRQLKDIEDIIADVLGIFNAGGGSIKAITQVIDILITVASMIKLLFNMKKTLISELRYHLGCRYNTLLTAGCEKLGLTFSSSVFQGLLKDAVFLPPKTKKGNNKKGQKTQNFYPEAGSGYDTFDNIIKLAASLCNGRVLIKDGILHIEPRGSSFWKKKSSFILREVKNMETYTTNMDELVSNYILEFKTDSSDLNTLSSLENTTDIEIVDSTNKKYKINETGVDTYKNTIIQYQQIPENDNSILKGYENITIGTALGTRKNELSTPEQIFNAIGIILNIIIALINSILLFLLEQVNLIIAVLDTIIDVINVLLSEENEISIFNYINFSEKVAIPDFGNQKEKIGALNLSYDFFSIAKTILANSDGKLYANHRDILGAFNLFDTYYKNELSFINGLNQYKVFKNIKIKLSLSDFEKVTENNIFVTDGDIEGEFENINYSPYGCFATVDFRTKHTFTTKIQGKYTIPE